MKSVGAVLRRIYSATVEKPLSWTIIDKLSALDDERDEREPDKRTPLREGDDVSSDRLHGRTGGVSSEEK